ALCSACLFSTSSDPLPYGGCTNDTECPTASDPCRENRCVAGACVEGNVPSGVASRRTETGLVCRRLVCDGQGHEQSLVDPTAVTDTPHDCKQTSCDAQGNPVLTPNTSDVP